jgi:hypothetical protein
MKILVFFLIGGFLVTESCFAQGNFQNLGFENANVSSFAPGASVPTISAFPGWQALIGGIPTSQVPYDDETLGAASIDLFDNKSGYTPLQGNYTAFLQSAMIPIMSTAVALSQTGTIPIGTQSIELYANQEEGSTFTVTLSGQTINMVALQSFSSYTLYGGNVSAWAGQSANLTITELPPSNEEFSPCLLQLDNITFSTTSVPDSDPFVLTGLGGTLFALYRRFAPKRCS